MRPPFLGVSKRRQHPQAAAGSVAAIQPEKRRDLDKGCKGYGANLWLQGDLLRFGPAAHGRRFTSA